MAAAPLVTTTDDGGGVRLLVLRHPPVNALSTAVLTDLDHAVTAVEGDPTTRCLVLVGDGPYFSAGADLKEVATLAPSDAPGVVARGQALFDRIDRFRTPVVAAINGLAVGGGLELALACDLRVASDAAKLGAPEVAYGLLPAYGGTQRLPRLVGPSKAKELIFTGHLVPAAEALRIGLVNRVVPSGQEIRAARDLAHTIAERAPRAVAGAKVAIHDGLDRSLAEGLAAERAAFAAAVVGSADLSEGIRAFLERRPPKFTGA